LSDANPIICWLRRDLRLHDHLALHAALQTGKPIIVLFIFDPAILKSQRMAAVRVQFMLSALESLDAELRDRSRRLLIRHGDPVDVLDHLVSETGADRLFFNRDYTPFARKRDDAIIEALTKQGVEIETFHDRLLVPPEAIATKSGTPYTVYTPFKKKWRDTEKPYPYPVDYTITEGSLYDLTRVETPDLPTLADLGFESDIQTPPASWEVAVEYLGHFMTDDIFRYHETRNRLANPYGISEPDTGTSAMSPYIRFGLISLRKIREMAGEAYKRASKQSQRDSVTSWMDEIIWHEFYTHVLYHFPGVKQDNFDDKYQSVPWRDDDEAFERWASGRTGYPIVDACMRQMNSIGWMHNRGRMIVASFLTKDLLMHWGQGELYFMQRLMDGDLAQNNGGWQWAAGTGTDAQPYFRVFNPVTQSEKYDPDGQFIRTWVPELLDVPDEYIHEPWTMEHPPESYPPPIVDHSEARERALEAFGAARAT
jgi:deoxyribodipyrimidine photo-lyase